MCFASVTTCFVTVIRRCIDIHPNIEQKLLLSFLASSVLLCCLEICASIYDVITEHSMQFAYRRMRSHTIPDMFHTFDK